MEMQQHKKGGESVHGLAKNVWKHKIKIARKAKE
jgi:hypothetical protein